MWLSSPPAEAKRTGLVLRSPPGQRIRGDESSQIHTALDVNGYAAPREAATGAIQMYQLLRGRRASSKRTGSWNAQRENGVSRRPETGNGVLFPGRSHGVHMRRQHGTFCGMIVGNTELPVVLDFL